MINPLSILKDAYYYYFNENLNKGYWLNQQTYGLKRSSSDIANEIGCSENCLIRKIKTRRKKGHLSNDIINRVHTSHFHNITKYKLMFIFKLFYNKINDPIDELYPKVKSRNGKIFKKIILEMENQDKDTGISAARHLNLTRKTFYLLAARFVVVLYEFDSYYAERMDYFLKRTCEMHNKFYFDDLANPVNWYPNRSGLHTAMYFALRNNDYDEKVIILNASDLIKNKKKKMRLFKVSQLRLLILHQAPRYHTDAYLVHI